MKTPTPAKPIKRSRRLPNIDHTIPSPCISLCLLDETDNFCIGCFRTIDQLRDWCIMSAEEKIITLEDIKERKSLLDKS